MLSSLKTSHPVDSLSLKDLSFKFRMLLLLVSDQRDQAIHMLDLSDMIVSDNSFTFVIVYHLKQGRPGYQNPQLKLVPFEDSSLCVVTTCKKYLKRTKSLRGNRSKLFISYVKEVSRHTLTRWVSQVMIQAGLDVSEFSPHSTRAASVSENPPGLAGMDEGLLARTLDQLRRSQEKLTGPDGPFPLAEEDVQHFGTIQRYRCWQKGPNSLTCQTLPEFFNDSFARNTDREFLVYEGDRFTYGDSLAIAVALSRALAQKFGVERGRCVAIAGRNFPEWVFTLIAVNGYLSAVSLPVNAWWTGPELKYGLEDSQSCLLVADLERLDRAPFLEQMRIPAICMRAGARQPPQSAQRFEALVSLGKSLDPIPRQPVDQDDRAMLMYTSGTTAMPKGVLMSHRNICSAINTLSLFHHRAESKTPKTVILASPLFHVNGTHVGLFGAICRGEKMVLMYKWDPTQALQLIEREQVHLIVGVPTNTYDLVNHPDFKKYNTSSMINVGGGGAAFAAPMIKRVKATFKNARASTGYGLTETDAISVVMPAELFPARPTSCGLPVVNVDVCILGDDGQKLPPGGVGEICFRGATVMQEYWRKPSKTAEVFHIDDHGHLWFRSGDIGALDEQNFVYILDRAKDIIIRGGENISCAEVEQAIFDHPAVAEVAAVGMPHENLGETVAVAVVFKKDVSPPPAEELQRHAASLLPRHMVPAEVFVWKMALPRGATGKIQKKDIRDYVMKSRKGQDATAPFSKL